MSSAVVKNSLKDLKSFLQDYQTSFASGLLILFTACCEQIFKETAFKCPCKHAYSYVCAFVFAPAGVLFLLGIVISNLTWRLFHGCSSRRSEDQNQKINCDRTSGDQKQKIERTEDQKQKINCEGTSGDQKQKIERTEDQTQKINCEGTSGDQKQKIERTEDQKVKSAIEQDSSQKKSAALKKYANGFGNTTLHFSKVLAKSLVIPLAWIFMVALDGNYYACAMAGEPSCNKAMETRCNVTKAEPCNVTMAGPCNVTMAGPCNEMKGYNDYKTESQICAWIGLVILVCIAVVVICCVRCCDPVTYEQNKFIVSYRDAEQQKLDTAIQEHTEKLAKENVECFMKKNPSKEDWDFISKTPECKAIKTDESVTIFLTHLNNLVKEYPEKPVQQGTNNSVQPAQQGTNNSA